MKPTQEQSAVAALLDIANRAEQECEAATRRGEKQGNYRAIASRARSALRSWTDAEISALSTENET